MRRPTDTSLLAEAKSWLRERLDKGERCPCCGQRAQTYKRKATASQLRTAARVLATQEQQRRDGNDTWVYLPFIQQRSRDFSTLRFFDLIEQRPGEREDGGAAGWWRVTDKGVRFLQGNESIPKYAKVYDGRRLGFDGPEVTVRDVAPKFKLRHLMEGV